MADVGNAVRPSTLRRPEWQRAGGARPRMASPGRERPSPLIVPFIISLVIPINFFIGPIRLSPYRVALLLLFLPSLAALFSGAQGKVRATDLCMIGFALWGALAVFLTTDVDAAIQPAAIFVIESLGAYLAGRYFVRDQQSFDFMARFMFVLLAALLPFALYETLTGHAVLLQLLDQLTHTSYSVMQDTRMGLHRASVLFEHPILYGAFAASAFGISLYATRQRKAAALGRTAPTIVALAALCSISSGAIAALLVQGILSGWDRFTKRIKRRWMILAGGFAVLYEVIDLFSNRDPFQVMASYLTFSPQTAYTRLLIWQYGSADAMRHPLFGIGLADWVRPSWMGPSIDNFWLVIALRYGMPSLGFLVLAIVLLLTQAGRRRFNSSDLVMSRAGLFVSLGGLIIAASTVDYWNAMYCWFMFLIGSGVWLIGAEDRDAPAPETRTSRRGKAGAGQVDPEAVPVTEGSASVRPGYTRLRRRPLPADHSVS